MKALTTITDPVYIPKQKYTAYDKFWLRYINDPRDLPFIYLLTAIHLMQTYINGQLVAKNGQTLITAPMSTVINNFSCAFKEVDDFSVAWNGEKTIPVIEALDGQLITNRLSFEPLVENRKIVSDITRDILKIVVVNRYHDAPVAASFIKNFGLQQGALASTVAHDSHNIVAVGVDDESICKAVNLLIANRGGVSCVVPDSELVLPLPVAGLMSNEDGYSVARQYSMLDQAAKEAGSTLASPFMTLSFMALLVIPHLKLSDKGLFDGDSFTFVE
ncbi:adenine deaminase domain protein [Ostertagia ostertagi]